MKFCLILSSLILLFSCSQKTSPIFIDQNYHWDGNAKNNAATGLGIAYAIPAVGNQKMRYCGQTDNGFPKGKGNWYDTYITSGNWDEGSCLEPTYYLREISLSDMGFFLFIDGGRQLKLKAITAPTWHPLYYIAQPDSLESHSTVDSIYLTLPGVSDPMNVNEVHYFYSGENRRSGFVSSRTYHYFYIEVKGEIRYRIMQTIMQYQTDLKENWQIIYQKDQTAEDLTEYPSFLAIKMKLGL